MSGIFVSLTLWRLTQLSPFSSPHFASALQIRYLQGVGGLINWLLACLTAPLSLRLLCKLHKTYICTYRLGATCGANV